LFGVISLIKLDLDLGVNDGNIFLGYDGNNISHLGLDYLRM
jgi:hypothetical protein